MRTLAAAILVVLFSLPSAHAWSNKEHIQFTRMAAERLIADPQTPEAMKAWLKEITPGLLDDAGEKDYFLHTRIGTAPSTYGGVLLYATRPDVHAFEQNPQKIEYFNAIEKAMHFIDLELFLAGDQKRAYADDLSGKPKLEDIPHDLKDPRFAQAGYLPLRVEYCYGKLVESLKEKRLLKSETKLEDEEDSAVRWAGYLAHYIEDNTQPQHATMDYKSATYFVTPRKAPNVHAEVEYKMCDDEKNPREALRAEFWPLFEQQLKVALDPAQSDDLFTATLQVSLWSYDALPMIGRAAKASLVPVEGNKPDEVDTDKFFRETGEFHGQSMTVMQMKAIQTAIAVKRVEKLWRKAWDEANKQKSE